jgi:hypothetical protein
MKKTLIAVFLLLVMVSYGKETSGQETERQPQNYFLPPNLPSVSPAAETGSGGYLTHPEFSGIITATITTPAQNTGDGYIFVAPLSLNTDGYPAVVILDETGEPVYFKTLPTAKFAGDFNKQTVNGTDYLTYHAGILSSGFTYGTSYVLDENYQIVDTWTIDNNSGSDVHDFLLLDNGHAILMAYVTIPFDLSPYGGPINGTLIDIVLQEQDANKNVVFEWHGSQHMPIEDTELNLNTTEPVDYLHTNGIAVDDDGNWLLSHRHFSEITKISRQTGEIIWRMGGAGNEFTFTNDIGFFNQHHINRLENGHISLFDNGNLHDPPHSRAIEYAIDETAKTVTRVWVYPDDTDEYASAMGNFQRLPNGNSFIGWGTLPKITEVLPDGTVALEMLLNAPNYRAFRYPWEGTPTADPRAVIRYDADPTAVTIYTSWNGATGITGYDIYAGPTTATLSKIKYAPRTGFETTILVTQLPPNTCFFQTKPIHAGSPTPSSNIMFRVDIPACQAQLIHLFIPLTTNHPQ